MIPHGAGGRFQAAERPLRWEPLGAWLTRYFGEELTEVELGRRLGVTRHIVHRWKAKGLTLDEGDRLATKVLGEHMSAIWHDYF